MDIPELVLPICGIVENLRCPLKGCLPVAQPLRISVVPDRKYEIELAIRQSAAAHSSTPFQVLLLPRNYIELQSTFIPL
jgi:hypothetical protein